MQENFFRNKQALILGCGYVGCAVGRALVDAGAQVAVLTRNADRAREAEGFARQVICCDLDSEDWRSEVAPRQDLVLNCVSSAGGGLDGYRKSYISGMESVIAWARDAQVGAFVYTSATSVYPQSQGELVREVDVPEDLTASGALLRNAERLIENADDCWERAYILRLGAIYGPGRHHLLDALKRGETTFPGEGDFILNYIHRDDITAAVLAAFADVGPGGVYNVVDGAHPTKRDVVEWLAGQIGAPKPVFDPALATRRGAMRISPQGKLPHRKVSNEKLCRELGWAPQYRDFRAGYAPMI